MELNKTEVSRSPEKNVWKNDIYTLAAGSSDGIRTLKTVS